MNRTLTSKLRSYLLAVKLLTLASLLSGCYATIGTPGAIREHYRGLNGTIAEAKASPDKETAYWQTQKQHDGLKFGGEQ